MLLVFYEQQNITDISREIPLAFYEQQNITDISRKISLAFYEKQNITDISLSYQILGEISLKLKFH